MAKFTDLVKKNSVSATLIGTYLVFFGIIKELTDTEDGKCDEYKLELWAFIAGIVGACLVFFAVLAEGDKGKTKLSTLFEGIRGPNKGAVLIKTVRNTGIQLVATFASVATLLGPSGSEFTCGSNDDVLDRSGLVLASLITFAITAVATIVALFTKRTHKHHHRRVEKSQVSPTAGAAAEHVRDAEAASHK